MQDRDLVAKTGTQITPTAVRDYVKSRGWKAVEGSRRRLWIFIHPNSELRQLIIPMDQDSAWNDALLEIIIRLAETEGSSFDMVLNNLLSSYSDVVRFRVGGDESIGGMLPMTDATELINGATRALLASACSVINKVKHHARMSRVEAEDFIRMCKMGQTEIGSYVVKVVCPLNETQEPSFPQESQPFAREVTSVLMSGCDKIVKGIENDNVEKMLELDTENPVVTSNLCDALLMMHAAREKNYLAIETSWSAMPKFPLPALPCSVKFKHEYFKTVEEIQRQLRPKKEQEEETMLFGTVETLNGDVADDGRRSGEVVFSLLLSDEEVVRARGNLNAEDYEKALQAHEKGRGYVAFKGVLKRGARIGWINEINDFRELISKPRE